MQGRAAAAVLVSAFLCGALPLAAENRERLDCRVHETPQQGRLATCTGRVSPKHPAWTWVLIGTPPDRVTRIEIYEPNQPEPRQVLEGFEARPPLRPNWGPDKGHIAFVLQDVNFDRMPDLRLATGDRDETGFGYRWWLFDKESETFVASDALGKLRSPTINNKKRLLIAAAKDERGRTARIVYRWKDGVLTPVGAQAYERTEDGRCIRSHYTVKDGKFEKLRETECRLPAEHD